MPSHPNLLARRPLWIALAVALMALVAWSSHRSWQGEGQIGPAWGNLLHFPTYAVLAALWALGLGGGEDGSWRRRWPWLVAPLIAVAFGLADEIHQDHVPGRTCSLFDLFVDFLGAGFASMSLWTWRSPGPAPRLLVRGLAAVVVVGFVLAWWGARWAPGLDSVLRRG